MKFDIQLSHPAWVCGLKQFDEVHKIAIQMSHPAWVCGLKPNSPALVEFDSRHTLRGCVD